MRIELRSPWAQNNNPRDDHKPFIESKISNRSASQMKESESFLRSLAITTMDEFDWIRIMCDYDTMPDFRGVLFSYDYTIQIVAATSVCKFHCSVPLSQLSM